MQLPVVGRSNIIDAANMLSQHNRAVKVDPNYMVIRITGEHASFSVPGTRAESVTYDVPTFAALKGAIDNAYWHPGIETIPAVLYVHNKIIKRRVTVNGSNDMVSRNQRSIECLEDVNYSEVSSNAYT